jgi:hypothetical protein
MEIRNILCEQHNFGKTTISYESLYLGRIKVHQLILFKSHLRKQDIFFPKASIEKNAGYLRLV